MKLALIRAARAGHGLAGVRVHRGDWFAWVTCGGSGVVEACQTSDHVLASPTVSS